MPETTIENPWKETVRDIFDALIRMQRQRTKIERHILELIEDRHHDYFCEGKTMAEWKALEAKNAES